MHLRIKRLFRYQLKLFSLNTAQVKLVFKKLLFILGLMAVFASVIQQDFDSQYSDALGSSQESVAQLDKDNNRDAVDTLPATAVVYNHPSESSSIFYFKSASYQEPTLLVHLRPPNA